MHGPKIGSLDVMQCNFLFMTSSFYLPLGKSKLLPNYLKWFWVAKRSARQNQKFWGKIFKPVIIADPPLQPNTSHLHIIIIIITL